MKTLENQNAISPKGEKASADYFTGTAWVNMLVPEDESGNYSIGNVVFEPGCRNNWHILAAAQIRLVTDGKGYYQERGKRVRSLRTGDEVVIFPGVEHWQGATPYHSFTQVVISNNSSEAAVKWQEAVTDEEYNNVYAESLQPPKGNLAEAATGNREAVFPDHKLMQLKNNQ